MKKNFLGIFALSTCLLLSAAACGETKSSYNVESAANYIQEQYIDTSVKSRVDYELPAYIELGGVKYDIVWTVTDLQGNAIDYVTIKVQGDKAIIDLDQLSESDKKYELKATITAPDGSKGEAKFLRTLLAAPAKVTSKITAAPEEGVSYQYHVYQSTKGLDLYFAGDMNGYYFKTTEKFEEATDLFVEYVEGSTELFNIYFLDGNSDKQYIGVEYALGDDNAYHNNVKIKTTPVSQFKWNADITTVTTTIDIDGTATEFYLGNYGSNTTISASKISYAGGEGNNVGHLVTLVDRDTVDPEDKVKETLKELNLPAGYVGAATVELQKQGNTFPDVTISWAVTEGTATIANHVLTLATPEANANITITATLKCGDKTDTKSFPIVSVKNDTTAILDAAEALESGKSFGNKATLTGVITKVDTAYDSEYGNITVTMLVGESKSVQCYRMNGTDADLIKVGDTITVTGTLKKYNSLIEFDTGCTLDACTLHTCNWTDATCLDAKTCTICGTVDGEALGHLDADNNNVCDRESCGANLAVQVTSVSLNITKLGIASQTYATTEATATVSGTTFGFIQIGNYGNGIQIRTNEGVHGSLWNTTAFSGSIKKIVLTYSSTKSPYDGNNYLIAFGTTVACDAEEKSFSTAANSTVITIDVSGAYTYFKLTHDNNYTQYWESIEIFYEGTPSTDPETPPAGGEGEGQEPETPVTGDPLQAQIVTSVAADTAYKFYMYQANANAVAYLKGGMNGYYLATTANAEEALTVYLETTEGGYYMYCMIDGVKNYINMVTSGSHVNGAYEATASTVYTFNTEYNTLQNADGYFFGTRGDNTYTTMGPCAGSYISSNFIAHFIATDDTTVTPPAGGEGEGEGQEPETPTEPEVPETPEKTEWTIAEIKQMADGEDVVLKGTVVEITEAWNTTYNNITIIIKDAAGDTIKVYRLGTLVALGDEITVTGKVGSYNGTKQIAQGSTAVITKTHVCSEANSYTKATCTTAKTCNICKATEGEALGHIDTDSNKLCDTCGSNLAEVSKVATFDFGENGTASHTDGNEITSNKSYTDGEYTLTLTSLTKVYGGARDAKGNSCLKLGTSSLNASFTFTVADDITKVIIYVAKYKANNTNVSINGGTPQSVSTSSNDGEYMAIEIDTTTNKTVTFATVGSTYRCMINTIEFYK